MFEIFMFWFWVSVFSASALYFPYWLFYQLSKGWLGFLLGKAGFDTDEIGSFADGYKRFMSTPLRLFHYDYYEGTGPFSEDEPTGMTVFKCVSLGASAIFFVCIATLAVKYGVQRGQHGGFGGYAVHSISHLSALFADKTAWLALPVGVFGGGSFVFVSVAKLLRKLKPVLDKLD